MREYGKFKKYINNFDKVFIQNKLNEGLTSRVIAPLVGIPEKRLSEMINHFDLVRINVGTTHVVNHHYFDEIDTEEKAYFLGFLVADGCVTQSKRKSGFLSKRITFCNAISDKEIIEKFRDLVYPTVQIKWVNKPTKTITRKDQASFKFTSEHMFDTLVGKYKIIPRKTHDVNFTLPDMGEYMRHFIRGFMDGDGHVAKNGVEFIFTSKNFLSQIKKFFEEGGFTTNTRLKKGITVDYYYFIINTNKRNNTEMYNLLYEGSSVSLERKRVKFEEKFTQSKTKIVK